MVAGGLNGGRSGGAFYDWRAAPGIIALSGAGGGGASDIQTCPISACPRYISLV
jgi:hypothetical protein